MEKAILVVINDVIFLGKKKEGESVLEELNRHLAEGWRVKHSSGMGGMGASRTGVSLVVLEKTG